MVNGATTPVYMTPEFARMLADIIERIGGDIGVDTASLEVLASFSTQSTVDISNLEAVASSSQSIALLAEAQDLLQQSWIALEASRAESMELTKRIENLEMQLQPIAVSAVDWTRPGKIGDTTKNTGKFTTLTADTTVLGDASATPYPLTVRCASGATGVKILGRASDGFGYMEWYDSTGATAYGSIFGFPGKLTITGPSGTNSIIVTNTGVTILNGFGCNGKALQTSYALGAAAVDLATVLVLANNVRTALINNGIGS